MKNKKGFTLVELIGVVILIGLIALIAIPSVDYVIKKTKDNAYDRTKDTLKDGLRNWVTDNKELIYEDGEEIIVTLSDLKEQGYIEYDIKNPKTSICLANTMQFKITRVKDNEKDTYEYEFIDGELVDGALKDCEAVSKTPSIYLLGDNPQKIEVTNDSTLTYDSLDPGATAKSSTGEDMSSSIVKTNNINLKVLSKDYHAKYTVIENGISKTVTRKVYVVDTTAPELNVPADLEIQIGETLNLMEGVTATDNSGVAPTIKTSGTINFNKEGEYKVIYIATDKSGNSTQKERIIKVFRPYYVMKHWINLNVVPSVRTEYHSDAYSSKIITIDFIDKIDIPADAEASWDLSESKTGTIMGWLEESTSNPGYFHLYIGSNGIIRANSNARYTFYNLPSVYEINFDNFDTQGVTDMYEMFGGCTQLSSIDISSFDTSSVQNMSRLFKNNKNLTEIEFGDIDTSNVIDMDSMFEGCTQLIDLDLSNFDTGNVIDMNSMFQYAKNLINLNLSSFDTKNVQDMNSMFYDTQALESLNLSSFNTEKVTNMSYMFYGTADKNLNLSSFDTSKVQNMSAMFSMSDLTSIDLSNFVTNRVTDMSFMFRGSNIEELVLTNFDTSLVQNMTWMFGDMDYLTNLNISSFNTSEVTNMSHMFYNMELLEELNVSNFNTGKVTNMSTMFGALSKVETLNLSNFNTSNVTDMSSMFYYSQALSSLNLSSFNTGNVTNMRYMFGETPMLKQLDLSSFTNMEKVERMDSMFSAAGAESIDLSNRNMPALTDISYMFKDASSAVTINLSNFVAPNVNSTLGYLFANTTSLRNLNLTNFKANNTTSLSGMFFQTGLETVDLSSFDASNVTSISSMFKSTHNLKTIKTPYNIQSTVNMTDITSYAFTGSDGNTYAKGTFPTGNTESITLTR